MREKPGQDGGQVCDRQDGEKHLPGAFPDIGDGRGHESEDQKRDDEFQQLGE